MAYKAKSITSKASSACKMNMGLVYGAADVAGSKKFVDHGKGVAEKFSGGGGGAVESKGAALDKKDEEEKNLFYYLEERKKHSELLKKEPAKSL